MNDDFDSIFDNEIPSDTTTEETVVTNDPVETTVEAVVEENDNVETTDHEKVIEETTEREPTSVPIAALLDTRDKLKDEKRRADEAERRLAEYQSSQANQHSQASFPDPYDDPEGYRAAIIKDVEDRFIAQKMTSSRAHSIEKHGEELTHKAIEWAVERANSDPSFEAKIIANDAPVEWIIREHNRHAELSEFETDREAFIRREAAKLGIGTTDQTIVPQTSTPNGVKNTAPRSLATVTSATKNASNEFDLTESFNSIFDRKR